MGEYDSSIDAATTPAVPASSKEDYVKRSASAIMRLSSRGSNLDFSASPRLTLSRKQGSFQIKRTNTVSNLATSSKDPNKGATVYVCFPWDMIFCHMQEGVDSEWTIPPGKVCELDEVAKPDHIRVKPDSIIRSISFPSFHMGKQITFCINDGQETWENNHGKNFQINTPGEYILETPGGGMRKLIPLLSRPVLVYADEINVKSVVLLWNPPIEGEANVSAYRVYRDDTILASELTERLFTCDNLIGATTYKFSVAALNEFREEGERALVEVTTAEPGKALPPRHLCLASKDAHHIKLCWTEQIHDNQDPQYYRVWRDGLPLAHIDCSTFEFLDDKITKGKTYEYCISAGCGTFHNIEVTADFLMKHKVGSENQSNFQDMINELKPKMESDTGNKLVVTCEEGRRLPRMWDGKHRILLQGFNWNSVYVEEGWYNVLNRMASSIADCEINIIWLPPPSQSVSAQGYMPSKLYDLDSKYGTTTQLKDLIKTFSDLNVDAMLDFVANHRCASKQDKYEQWTVFENPDWPPTAICSNNKQGYKHVGSAPSSGALSDCAPDIDHTNPDIRQSYANWLRWLINTIGYSAVRIDMAPGYLAWMQREYIASVGTPFTVGEYWSGDTGVLQNYIQEGGRQIASFDFPFYFHLRRAVEGGDFHELRAHDGRPNGIMGCDPGLSVTFIDNHDTEHLDFVGKFAGGDEFKLRTAYGIILTHPGTPCVYWSHFGDKGDELRKAIKYLGRIRKSSGIHSQSSISIHTAHHNAYSAEIRGDKRTIKVCIGDVERPNWENLFVAGNCTVYGQ